MKQDESVKWEINLHKFVINLLVILEIVWIEWKKIENQLYFSLIAQHTPVTITTIIHYSLRRNSNFKFTAE